MTFNEVLSIVMVIATFALLIAGFPVAFTLAGIAVVFAGIGTVFGVFDPGFLIAIPQRVYGVMTNEVLVAIPLFIFMGVMLERSKVAEDLLENLGRLFGEVRGGLGIAVVLVGALMAASTGIVGATVVTMGLLALPTMLRYRYDPALATGVISASGTLGQIIPPSIILVLLGDVLSSAHQRAQLQQGIFAPETISVSELFAGAMLPGLLLVFLYIVYLLFIAWRKPGAAPAIPRRESAVGDGWKAAKVLVPPVVLIVAVLGSILAGIATPTEAAGVGALGTVLLAGFRLAPRRWGPLLAAACLVLLLVLSANADLRVTRRTIPTGDLILIGVAILACAGAIIGFVISLTWTHRAGVLGDVLRSAARLTAMIMVIIICASIFSVVFRGLDGDRLIEGFLTDLPGGAVTALLLVMVVMFLLGFFLDVIEITYVVVPIVAPALFLLDINPLWLGILMAINLQTSYLTPPFGLALFFLRGVAPPTIQTIEIYRGIFPFVAIQLLCLALVAAFPALATALPRLLFGN